MMNRVLALGFAILSTAASAQVSSCSLSSNGNLESQFYNRTFDGFFRANGSEVRTQVTFFGSSGIFTRNGSSSADSLSCVRYLTIGESANEALRWNTQTLDASSYFFDTSSCQTVILADWSAGSSRGRVLWCVPSYGSSSRIEGVYWGNLDWTVPEFTDIWEGRWQ
jgi:hypothetical protein